jgi:hypothetical protein
MIKRGPSPIVISADKRTLMRYRLREKVPWSSNKGSHIVGLKPGSFLMNYGSRQGPLQ